MTHLPSGDDVMLARVHGGALLRTAANSIRAGFDAAAPAFPDVDAIPAPLRQHRATFVTLKTHGELRGCIGTIFAHRPVVTDVAANAHGAAFGDNRFAPLKAAEWSDLAISVSILSPLEVLAAPNEDVLLRLLRPGIDGLVLRDENRRCVFLPQVWEQLPAANDFVARLKHKGGFALDEWPAGLIVERFNVTSIDAQPAAVITRQ